MLQNLFLCEAFTTNPYENLAREEALLAGVPEDTLILYLWQNARTVVIGRNQNAWRECRVEKLREDGVRLARRLSGGGAVYHDLGNLNFTFLTQTPHYDLHKQLSVLQRAAASFGISAEISGRNDLTADGRKFSGNAFYQAGVRHYHHGTMMVDVNTAVLGDYLTVSPEKLRSKGVTSVRSRVVNLTELCSDITVSALREAMAAAFGEVYNLPVQLLPPPDGEEIAAAQERLFSWDWIYGRKLAFTAEFSQRFAWGEVQLQLQVKSGRVRDAACYSDAMETALFARISEAVQGLRYETGSLQQAVLDAARNSQETVLCQDLAKLIQREMD